MASNKDLVLKELQNSGITNKYSVAAVMAIIDKESGFKPQSEKAYSGNTNSYIRSKFEKTKLLNDAALTTLKSSPENFFDYIYGSRFGNNAKEGYKYRGRGFNQLTFKGNYRKFGEMIKMNLVDNPDLVNDPIVAAKVVAAFFKEAFKNSASIIQKRYGAANINDFKDAKTAVNAFYNANAGFKKDTSNVTTAGKTKALKKVSSFLDITPATGAAIGLPVLLITGLLIYYFNR